MRIPLDEANSFKFPCSVLAVDKLDDLHLLDTRLGSTLTAIHPNRPVRDPQRV
jgi:hypothetical protein